MGGTQGQYTFGFSGGRVTASTVDPAVGGTSVLTNVQQLQFADGTVTSASALPHRFDYTSAATSSSDHDDGTGYAGPVDYLKWQYVWSGADGAAIRSNAPSAFLKGGASSDALEATGGSNVLDGGLGSNFLVGATGADGGSDVFYVDARGGGVTWSTVSNCSCRRHGDDLGFQGRRQQFRMVGERRCRGVSGRDDACLNHRRWRNRRIVHVCRGRSCDGAGFHGHDGQCGGNDYLLVQNLG